MESVVEIDGEKFTKIISFSPAYDKTAEGYGIHGVELRMVLKGNKGAVQFVMFTGWMLKHLREKHRNDASFLSCFPMGADVGYHSKLPMYDGHEKMHGGCEYTDGACYYDGSGLAADSVMEIFISQGEDAVWRNLKERYDIQFKEDA